MFKMSKLDHRSSSSNGIRKLFVGDIGDNRKPDLTKVFDRYGEIITMYVDENKKFGFVEFKTPMDAERALNHTNNKMVNGSKLRVEFAKVDKPREKRDHSQLQPPLRPLIPSMYGHHPQHLGFPPQRLQRRPLTTRGRSLTPPSLKNRLGLRQRLTHDMLAAQDLLGYPPFPYFDYSAAADFYHQAAEQFYNNPYLMTDPRRPPTPRSYRNSDNGPMDGRRGNMGPMHQQHLSQDNRRNFQLSPVHGPQRSRGDLSTSSRYNNPQINNNNYSARGDRERKQQKRSRSRSPRHRSRSPSNASSSDSSSSSSSNDRRRDRRTSDRTRDTSKTTKRSKDDSRKDGKKKSKK
ncbi:unnamed protein product [Didymodactylos carnosus]|uniref:RRM domain-containing protein n=1 Tax=Didymodactylos carnosus TaxID=1234261 RepID=A0A814C9C2_9BILA|nr:unnamed protein product [Didymodactylos carnosus]CAF1334019.1 unnamed protein product [Didymodactylos carnosus]CAF3714102.1 unnamed protein product [Didymodactylos carnosus]CAF4145357.1 unnamed protein product [Didymodactylos carnosus]